MTGLANRIGIRHIQRGTFKPGSHGATTTISLSGFVNPDKMIAIINGGNYIDKMFLSSIVSQLSVDSLVVSGELAGNSSVTSCIHSYQVIEIY